MGRIIRQQVPDKDGRVIPPGTTEGSYELVDLDHLTRGYVYEGKLVLDRTYGRAFYGCGTCCGWNSWILQPGSFSGEVGAGTWDTMYAKDCTGYQYDITTWGYNFGSADTSVATLSWQPYLNLVGPGSTTTSGSVDLDTRWCFTMTRIPQQSVTSKPKITGPNTVWWFNGQTVSGYATGINLTASAGGATVTWSIYAGSDKVSLTPNGNQATVTSTGTAWSSATGDIKITASAGGQTSDQFALTTRKPYQLAFPQTQPNCKDGFGYESVISYAIQDQLQTTVPSAVPWNEQFTSSCVQDNSNGNWCSYGLPPLRGDTLTYLLDYISGPGTGNNPAPVPTPVCTEDSTQQQHWSQEFRVGSLTSGSGVRVQTDTLVRFTNHAEHQNIVSPAP